MKYFLLSIDNRIHLQYIYIIITSCASTLKNSNLVLRPLTPPSFRHLRDGMPPPLSGEASLFYRLKSAFYKFKFLKGNRNAQINLRLQFLPPLKGEVAKIDNFNCQFLPEGSGAVYICAVSRKIRNLLIYSYYSKYQKVI